MYNRDAHLDGVVLLLRVHALVHRVREVVATVLQHAIRGFILSLKFWKVISAELVEEFK